MCLFYLLLLVLHPGFWVRNVWTQHGCGQGQRKITWHRGRRPQDRGACSYIFPSTCFFSVSLFSCTFLEVCVRLCVCVCGCSFVCVFETHHNIVAYHQIIKSFQFSTARFPHADLSSLIPSILLSVREFACFTLSLLFWSFLCFFLDLLCFTWSSSVKEIIHFKKP